MEIKLILSQARESIYIKINNKPLSFRVKLRGEPRVALKMGVEKVQVVVLPIISLARRSVPASTENQSQAGHTLIITKKRS